MGRYTGPVCKLCRREAMKLFLKGSRCTTERCTLEKDGHDRPPGQQGVRPRKMSDYGIRLREKQRAKRMYGLLERQFRRFFDMAFRQRGPTGQNLLMLLERRLDSVVYRMGMAPSRRAARQLIRHGHYAVDGKKATTPSFLVKPGQSVEVKEKSRNVVPIKGALERVIERKEVPAWMEVIPDQMKGTLKRLPSKEELGAPVNEILIVEYYSGR